MVQVIVQQKSFQPALLFMFLVVIGNWMLLNLFLAILLRALSSPEETDDEPEIGGAEKESPDNDANEADQTVDTNKDKIAVRQNMIDSSNSNIDLEFEIIKEQIIAVSKGLVDANGTVINKAPAKNRQEDQDDMEIDEEESVSISDEEEKQKRRDKKIQKKNNSSKGENGEEFASDQQDTAKQVPGRSLFIFAHDNKLRVQINKMLKNPYFDGFIYHMIAINSVLLILDSPSLQD